MNKEKWYIIVGGGYGIIEKVCTREEAEEFRRHKANWEKAPAKKITAEGYKVLSLEQINKHWAYKQLFEYKKNIAQRERQETPHENR